MALIQCAASYSNSQNEPDIDIINSGGYISNSINASRIRLVSYLGVGGYNHTTQNNDCGIIFGNPENTTGFVIVPSSITRAGLRIQSNGTVNAVSFGATSDYRIKDNIVPLGSSISCLKLKPIQYTNTGTNREYYGFLAHEVQEHFPIIVEGEKDATDDNGNDVLQQIHYTQIIPILVNDIQTLMKEVKELKEEINILKESK